MAESHALSSGSSNVLFCCNENIWYIHYFCTYWTSHNDNIIPFGFVSSFIHIFSQIKCDAYIEKSCWDVFFLLKNHDNIDLLGLMRKVIVRWLQKNVYKESIWKSYVSLWEVVLKNNRRFYVAYIISIQIIRFFRFQ